MSFFLNPAVRRDESFRGLFSDDDYADVQAYFAAHPELTPSPLTSVRSLARTVGLGAVDAKDETHRFGINAFKIVGVSYAVHRLGAAVARHGLVCATAGNHGCAVARVARQHQMPCTVFVPVLRTLEAVEQQTRGARIEAMREDGARVIDVDGTYEEAVRRAAFAGRDSHATVISDTSWEGYEQIPRWIMAGYTQLFEEALRQWDSPPGLVVLQGGVGGLVCAAASWFAWRFGGARPYLVAAEPEHAACLLASARARAPVTIDGSLDTIMAGLRCATPSSAAWPAIAAGIDAFVSVSDARALEAMATLRSAVASERIEAGPSGVCGVAALMDIALAPDLDRLRSVAQVGRGTHALVIITEGP
jgi:diaminopropionate ammonia-lyase